MTHEARSWIGTADIVLHLVPDPVGESLIDRLSAGRNRSLRRHYDEHSNRRDAYEAMVVEIIDVVRDGHTACAAFYGHPGVFSLVPRMAIERARDEGFAATMSPGISAEDCLFADLLVDPADSGLITYEATDYLINKRVVDPTTGLVLWQIGKLAVFEPGDRTSSSEAKRALVGKLAEHYPTGHRVVLYEAATLPGEPPAITELALNDLPAESTHAGHTLYIPPAEPARADPRFRSYRP